MPFERAGGWQHDLPPAQSFLGLGQKFGDGATLDAHPRATSRADLAAAAASKPAQAQITTNALCLRPVPSGARPDRSRNNTGGSPSWRDK